MDEGVTKYTPIAGIPDLLQAIQTKFKRDNQLEFELNQIVVSNGAKQSIYNWLFAMRVEIFIKANSQQPIAHSSYSLLVKNTNSQLKID